MFLYNFGLSQEDERTESRALGLDVAPRRVLSIASAGEMPLSLLALGAERVTAVDVDPAQLHLVRLKLAAALRLPREEAIRFLGYLPATARDRQKWLETLLPSLPAPCAAFWRAAPSALARGAIWAGRFEQYVRPFAAVAVPLFGRRRIEALFECSSLVEQEEHFERAFRPTALRGLFRLMFHPRLYRHRGMDPRGLRQRASRESLGDQFFTWFRALCTATPARDNHLLQLFLLGRVRGVDAVPSYLTGAGQARLRERADCLTLVEQDLVALLRQRAAGPFDAVHLSNVADWLDADAFAEVMRLLCATLERPARIVWRALHVDRAIPAELASALQIDRELGRALRLGDRFPFYTIVPAVLS